MVGSGGLWGGCWLLAVRLCVVGDGWLVVTLGWVVAVGITAARANSHFPLKQYPSLIAGLSSTSVDHSSPTTTTLPESTSRSKIATVHQVIRFLGLQTKKWFANLETTFCEIRFLGLQT